MRTASLGIIVVVCLLLQMSFLPALRPFGSVPDLALVAIVLMGTVSTVSQALIYAVAGGIILDLASGADFGLRTALFVLAALATGLARRAGLTLGGPLVALALVAMGTLIQTLIILADQATHVSHWPVGYLLRVFVVELMLNLILTVMLQPLFMWLAPRAAALPTVE